MEEEDGKEGEEEELRTPTERKRGRAVMILLGVNLAKKAEGRRRIAAMEDVIAGRDERSS